MKSVIQFHALPSEIYSWIGDFLKNNAKIYEFYFKKTDGRIYSILLSEQSNGSELATPYKFLGEYPDSLGITIGEETSFELRQSSVGFISEQKEIIEKWRKFWKIVKSNTETGVKIIGLDGLEYGVSKTFRISKGARDFYFSGGRLLAFVGGIKYAPME